jgi:hypothetical protein
MEAILQSCEGTGIEGDTAEWGRHRKESESGEREEEKEGRRKKKEEDEKGRRKRKG